MKQLWQKFAANIDARNQRERTLIFVMVLVVIAATINSVMLEPLKAKRKLLAQSVQDQQTQLQTVRGQIQTIVSGGRSDPDAPTRVRLAALQQKLGQSSTALESTQQSLVAPEKMARLLEDVLSQNRNLKLVALKTLPAKGLLDIPEAKQAPGAKSDEAVKPAAPVIYKHGVEITVSGSYADLTRYLEALEKLPWRMFWGKAEMHVEQYPQVVLTITLYTLSMEKIWLSV